MDDTAIYCPHCGSRFEEAPADPGPYQSPSDAEPGPSGENAFQPGPQSIDESRFPLKWHKFQMVTMIIGAVLNVLTSFSNINGSAYLTQGLDPTVIYNAYPGLRTCDTAYGVAGLVIGVFQLYARNRLKGFFRDAIRTLLAFYLFSFAVQIVYIAAISSVMKTNAFSSVWTSLLSPVIMGVINGTYYNRRKELFVN